jgi:ribosomal protein S18 acetylase RimI-like enzyme
MEILPFTIQDYADAYALWAQTPGIGLSEADSEANVARYLARNPGSSFTAREDGRLLGTVLAGSDGRRGYLHHLVVEPAARRRGVGQTLVEASLKALRAQGIRKCHLFIFHANSAGQAFWRAAGWTERTDIEVFSRTLE